MQRLVEREEQDKFEIGDAIRNRRDELGLSQDQLADIVGTSRQMVSRYENGGREMGVSTLLQYAEALDISAAELLPANRVKASSKQRELMQVTEGLSDGDLEILIAMAARMKK